MRFILVTMMLCVGLAACETGPTPEMLARYDAIALNREPPAISTGAFNVIDKRAAETETMRLMPIGWAGGFSCDVGILQLGYALYAPDRVARLENAIAAAFPDKPKSSDLIVRRFDIYMNRGAEADAAAWGAAMGSVGVFGVGGVDSNSVKITRTPKCSRDKMGGGWFDPADLTNNNPPLTIDLDVTVFGKPYTVNAAASFDMDAKSFAWALDTKSPAVEVMLLPLQKKAIDRLLAQIKAAGN